MAGQFFWYELLSTDVEKSLSFFAGLLDCDVLRAEEDSAAFFLAPKGTDAPLFGVLAITTENQARSHWMGYLMVEDLDRAIQQTEEAGGTLHLISDDEPDRAEDAARFAVVTDGQGAVVNLHQEVEGQDPGEDLPELGHLAWIELLTTDLTKAVDFYHDLVGWEVGAQHDRGDEGPAHALFRNDRVFGLMRNLPAGSSVPPNWVFYVRVPDLEKAMEHVRALGGFQYEDAAQVDGGRRVLMLDPTGAPVALWAAL